MAGLFTESIGSAAAFCTTISFVPQLVRVLRRRSAEDISLAMFLLFSTGVALWLIYGLGIGSMPVIAANGVTLVLAVSILVLKLRYERRTCAVAEDAVNGAAVDASGKIKV